LKNIESFAHQRNWRGGPDPLICPWSLKRKRSNDNFWAVGDRLVVILVTDEIKMLNNII